MLAQLSPRGMMLDDYARTKLMTMEGMPWSAQTHGWSGYSGQVLRVSCGLNRHFGMFFSIKNDVVHICGSCASCGIPIAVGESSIAMIILARFRGTLIAMKRPIPGEMITALY